MAIPSSRCKLLLLLVAIAATFPHFSATGVFAQAQECKDKQWVGKITKKGVRYDICDWVAFKKTKKRCKQIIKQKGIRKMPNGKKKKIIIEVKPWRYCGCVCEDYQPEEDEGNGAEKICPAELVESNEVRTVSIEQRRSSIVKKNQDVPVELDADRSSFVTSVDSTDCLREGYEKWRTCSYGMMWTGCTYEDLECNPKVECTCAPDFVSDGKEWKCKVLSYEQCEEPPRPAFGEPAPIGIPPMVGESCMEGDMKPRPPQEQSEERSGILGI